MTQFADKAWGEKTFATIRFRIQVKHKGKKYIWVLNESNFEGTVSLLWDSNEKSLLPYTNVYGKQVLKQQLIQDNTEKVHSHLIKEWGPEEL